MSDDVTKIKERLPIQEVLQSYIKLEKAGDSIKARCPFHNEKTPSFTITPDKGVYYCFGCGRGGDIFTFLQEIEGIDFSTALVQLAERAGVVLSREKGERKTKKRLYEVLEEATKLYEITIRKDKEVLAYLYDRGVSKESIAKFRIGYAPNSWNYLYNWLIRKGYGDKEISEVGLSVLGKKGYYDRFRERIMFPITDSQGRVIGFTGRIFCKEDSKTDVSKLGKYVNTNDTELYDKSRVLYGYSQAKRAMKDKDRVVLVEGQLDVVLSVQAGVGETVAISGTALSYEQVGLIERFTDNVVLALDADSAGVKAVNRSLEVLYAKGMNVSVVLMPQGADPADLVASGKSEKWKELVSEAEDYITFRLKVLSEEGLTLRKSLKAVQSDIYPLLSVYTSPIIVDKYLQDMAKFFSVDIDSVRGDYLKWKKKNPGEGIGGKKEVIKPVNQSKKDQVMGLALWLLDKEESIEGELVKIRQMYGVDPGEYLKENETYAQGMVMMAERDYGRVKLAKEALLVMLANEEIKRLEVEREKLLLNIKKEVSDDKLKEIQDISKRIEDLKNING